MDSCLNSKKNVSDAIICYEKIAADISKEIGLHLPSVSRSRNGTVDHSLPEKSAKANTPPAPTIQLNEQPNVQAKKPFKARKPVKLTKYQQFLKLTKKMNPIAKQFIWMQMKHVNKKLRGHGRGRRFSDVEKLIAATVFKESRLCYEFLGQIFQLPSHRTLTQLINNHDLAECRALVISELNNFKS